MIPRRKLPVEVASLLIAAAILLAGCSAGSFPQRIDLGADAANAGRRNADLVAAYAADRRVPSRFRRQTVRYASSYAAGTVVVDTPNHYLYFIEGGGRATRYGISVGSGGFAWSGEASVGLKRPWPRWTPPSEMIGRAPRLARYRRGLEGGGINPLGARAIYLYQGGRDTLYRLHGTPEWWTIGGAATSGCIRLLNDDVIDLYDKVQLGSRVVVLPSRLPFAAKPKA